MGYWEMLGAVTLLALGLVILTFITYEMVKTRYWDRFDDALTAMAIFMLGCALVAAGIQVLR